MGVLNSLAPKNRCTLCIRFDPFEDRGPCPRRGSLSAVSTRGFQWARPSGSPRFHFFKLVTSSHAQAHRRNYDGEICRCARAGGARARPLRLAGPGRPERGRGAGAVARRAREDLVPASSRASRVTFFVPR
jgi:hypothetical protein